MKLLRLPEVQNKIGLKGTRIYQMVGDGTFPKPLKLSTRSIAWLESDVDAWIMAKAAEPRAVITTKTPKRVANSNQCTGISRVQNLAHAKTAES